MIRKCEDCSIIEKKIVTKHDFYHLPKTHVYYRCPLGIFNSCRSRGWISINSLRHQSAAIKNIQETCLKRYPNKKDVLAAFEKVKAIV